MKTDLTFFNQFMFRAENGDWFVKPICDFFGIDYENQTKRINNDKICQTDTGKNLSEQVFGDKIQRLTLRDRGFSRWIQIINPSIIAGELTEKFEIFQANIFDYLWNGNIQKREQLEDIRTFSESINKALKLKRQVQAFVREQNKIKNICMESEPSKWAELKSQIIPQNKLPFEELKQLL
jgi:hypothetical protein